MNTSKHQMGDLVLSVDGYLGYIKKILVTNPYPYTIEFFDEDAAEYTIWSLQDVKQAKARLREKINDQSSNR
jgi:hypothetical protein